MTSSSSTSRACDVNACAASSNTARLESFADRLNRVEMRASNNHDDLLLIQGILDNLRACSDSQLSFLLNQSQILCGTSQLKPSSQVSTVSAEITEPKEVKRLITKAGSASVSAQGQ